MNRINIRQGTLSDANDIVEMAIALSAHEGEPAPPFGAREFGLYGFGEKKLFDTFIAEYNTIIVGYLLFCDSFHVGAGTPGLHMIDLFVKVQYRKLGVGRALMKALARTCLEREGTWLTWESVPYNTEALSFYSSLGARKFAAANFELADYALVEMSRIP